jgi:dihydroorotate dehydrogenase (NAD+) catalytic subunit
MPKRDLDLRSPWMNATGMLGFAPNPRGPVDLGKLGAFITNPVSLRPRTPAENRSLLPFPGGFLLHTGWPNPGLRAVLRRWAARWADASLPVVLHLMVSAPDELAEVAERLEGLENLAALEISLPPGSSREELTRLVEAAAGELPLIVHLPFENAAELAQALADSGATAFSLAAPRGLLPIKAVAANSGKPQAAPIPLSSGRLYGPGLLPQALQVVRAVARAGLPVFGSGGVFSRADAEAMLAAGAAAVQLDTLLWGDFSPF